MKRTSFSCGNRKYGPINDRTKIYNGTNGTEHIREIQNFTYINQFAKTSIAWNNDNLCEKTADLTVNDMDTSELEHNLSDTQN